ncbi:ATP phosphoribosyltransferase regulatory subunit [Chromobacterium amazonense]|uniref:ATP phosphoribosyltransferase regulatory subunit n=1 Tax=Chromobacterium amazonense TaxID=1382803 RepID=A0A1S1XEM5_9NEIS|nr:ATP phosphoribosyltransferase regulatory subunit [Chromobacterium amazonense]MBM2884737.1 ATP phosphoribosyltransferase regulatory subunit [Chromobacterium amazonense]MDE1714975.1 ATP phosphoribosyltransferase regulatory subunit [Chromobacterium amazonense]MDQ4540553.1 ATP phosphoribosyltransferase regulatory subunit [Chromobacterium amazonense]OHX18763.1 ATP phosphoribosyltransferase regulatory subunit [Chromobacterium amazonense]PRP71542.1 ATP phosphoribosyltransferase regulatory subunit 
MRNWLLPEYIADILPATARQVESAKAAMLEGFRVAGYELVLPPLIEYIDSLVSEGDVTLDLKTFKLDDQLSGRQLGLRADITPQVARIDAHLLGGRTGVTRLCYAGSVVHSRPSGLTSSREPLQVGAELYGYAGIEADLEIIDLMLSTLEKAGVEKLRLDVGHIAIYRGLAAAAGLAPEVSRELFSLLQNKDAAGIAALVAGVAEPYKSAFLALPELYGPAAVLEKARTRLPSLPEVELGLMQLSAIARAMQGRAELSFDLAELRGDFYHTGLMFAAYAPGWSDAIARGGRYDNVGRRFGRARPATGFSLDLRDLLRILPERDSSRGIRVSARHLPAAAEEVARLRAAGEMVVVDYLGESAEALNCDRELVPAEQGWQLAPFH